MGIQGRTHTTYLFSLVTCLLLNTAGSLRRRQLYYSARELAASNDSRSLCHAEPLKRVNRVQGMGDIGAWLHGCMSLSLLTVPQQELVGAEDA
jgi:hypothetical protein